MTPSDQHVMGVLLDSPRFEMGRINTRGVIAFMANQVPLRYGTYKCFVG